jgi:hypothetical protein
MAFNGPQAADYDNVASLNRAYLSVLCRDARSHAGLAHLSADLYGRLIELTAHQVERLAEAPFLLLSFREHDEHYWNKVLDESADRDLFSVSDCVDLDTVVSAGLGFVWQLARQNPYTLRLFCGASLYWCERIAEQTFYNLVTSVAAQGSIPELRNAHDQKLWHKLLIHGVSKSSVIRQAAHLSALQSVLTRPGNPRQPHWARAARTSGRTGLRVADETS